MRNDSKNILVEKAISFSLRIIKYVELLESKKKFVIATQLLKAGTSIGANIMEAQNAESKNDFIHKMKIAAKETSETIYWLTLCKKAEYDFDESLMSGAIEILRILSKIIATSKNNLKMINLKI